ncbi:uncharacterized protein in vnfD 5'region [Bemisia tabaci]
MSQLSKWGLPKATTKSLLDMLAPVTTPAPVAEEWDRMSEFLILMDEHPERYVDKTLFLRRAMEPRLTVVTRPRGFGKTLMLSTLEHFLDARQPNSSTDLFKNLSIMRDAEFVRRHKHKYPIIRLDFGGVKNATFPENFRAMKSVVAAAYLRHSERLLQQDEAVMDSAEKEVYSSIMEKHGDENLYLGAIQRLCKFIYKAEGVRPIVLIDEYDTPLVTALDTGHYHAMIKFMRGFYRQTLDPRENDSFEKGVLTGVTNIHTIVLEPFRDEVKVYSIFDDECSNFLGFTQAEVNELVSRGKHGPDALDRVQKMYGGYKFGNSTLYNPFSVSNYLFNEKSRPWMAADPQTQASLEKFILAHGLYPILTIQRLINGEDVIKKVPGVLGQPETGTGAGETSYWAYLIQFGFLSYSNLGAIGTQSLSRNITLRIPNEEVRTLLRDILYETDWSRRFIGLAVNYPRYDNAEALTTRGPPIEVPEYRDFIHAFTTGNFEEAREMISKYIRQAGVFFNPHDEVCSTALGDYVGQMLSGVAWMKNSTLRAAKSSEKVAMEVVGIPARVAIERTGLLRSVWLKTKSKVCEIVNTKSRNETEILITCGEAFVDLCLRRFEGGLSLCDITGCLG